MMTFLQAINHAATMPEETKALWRVRCRDMYFRMLMDWARAHPNDTVEESERLMRDLCGDRDAETLEQWCLDLKLLGNKIGWKEGGGRGKAE